MKSTRKHKLASACTFGAALLAALLAGCGDGGNGNGNAVAAGEAAVATWDCASCHQQAGSGTLAGSQTPVPGTNSYAQNLTSDDETGMGEWSDEQLATAILTGIDDENEELCPIMPRFGDLGMSEDEANNIIAYLRSLPAVSHEIPESECPPIKGGE